jgi:YVTN family beta-propeller protein
VLAAGPNGVAYDSGKGEIFVANEFAGSVSVISEATNTIIATIPVGVRPWGVAYDAGRGEIFVSNRGSRTVSVISDATNTVVATIQIPPEHFPGAMAYDAGKDEIFVGIDSSVGDSSINVISDTTNTVVATFPIDNFPSGLAYDPVKGEIFVSCSIANSVNVVSDATNTVVAKIHVGDPNARFSWPTGIAYDSGRGEIFVADNADSAVSVISDATHTVVATIPAAGSATTVAYAPRKGEIFVANWASVNVISDATNTVVCSLAIGEGPGHSAAYDPVTGYVYLSNYRQGTISIISPGAPPPPPTYDVNFTETGLPAGTSWSVTLGGTTQTSTTNTITFSKPDGTYAYTVGQVAGYPASPASGSATVNGATVSTSITFTALPPPTFGVSFTTTGLPAGTSWSVTLTGMTQTSTGSTIAFSEPNGTYAYSIGFVPGYMASPSSGSVTVNGGTVSTTITFTAVPPPTYDVTFTETSLPAGTSWLVTLAGTTQTSTGSTITFSKPDGTYAYTMGQVAGSTVSPSSGSVTVNGGSASVSITFTAVPPPTYPVSFAETGLPAGTSWSVTLAGTTQTSTTGTIVFSEADGTYAYSIASVSGYTASPSSGSVTVNGVGVSTSITFTAVPPPTYDVSFTETGLPVGTSWTVTLAGTTHISTGSAITFTMPDGTYAYAIGSVPGFSTAPGSGSIDVHGSAVAKTVGWTPVTYTVMFEQSGLSASTSWSVTVQGTTRSSTRTRVVFAASNGTVSYTVGSVTGYTASPASGAITVDGHDVMQAITYTQVVGPPTISSFSSSASAFVIGSKVTFTATASGGTGALTYAYRGLPSDCSSANVSSLTCTPTATGTFTITVTVTDAAGRSATATVEVAVNQSHPLTSTIFGLEPPVFIGVTAFVIAIAQAGFLVVRRRMKRAVR